MSVNIGLRVGFSHESNTGTEGPFHLQREESLDNFISQKKEKAVLHFFLGHLAISLWRISPTKTVSDFYWLKIPFCSCNCPWYHVCGISFERFSRPWQKVGPLSGPSGVADSSLAFFKEVGSSSGVTPSLVRLHMHVWWADASRKQTSTPVRRKPPCLAWSGVSPPVPARLEWLSRIAPRIIDTHKAYHDDNVGTQSAEALEICICTMREATPRIYFAHRDITA